MARLTKSESPSGEPRFCCSTALGPKGVLAAEGGLRAGSRRWRRAARNLANNLIEASQVDRLHQMFIETHLLGASAICRPTVTRDRDEHGRCVAESCPHALGEVEAVHYRRSDVQQR